MTETIWALLVGINKYESPDIAALQGCVNDVEAMRAFLTDSLNVPARQIKALTDADATRNNILQAFRDFLIRNPDIVPGSQILFHYSGHGSQMPSTSPDEPDGMDETIVPYDSRGTSVFDIPDKTLAALIDRLAKSKGENITVILDSCHSGSGTRKLNVARTRRIAPDRRVPPPDLDVDLRTEITPTTRSATRGVRPSGWESPEANHVLLAGCRDREESNEYWANNEICHGALSYFALEYLRQMPEGASYTDLYEYVRGKVSVIYPTQTPQCEGARERKILGTGHVEREPFIVVMPLQGGKLSLNAGQVHGLQTGAEITIYPPEVRSRADLAGKTPLGRAEITRVGATTAEAAPKGDLRLAAGGAKAVVSARVYQGMRQRVAIEAEAVDSALGERIRQAARISGTDGGESLYIAFVDPALEVYDLKLGIQAGRLNIYNAADDALLIGHDDLIADGTDPVTAALAALESIGRYRSLLALRNQESGSAVQSKIRIRLRPSGDTADLEALAPFTPAPDGTITLSYYPEDRARNQYLIEIVNESNQAMYPTLFALGSDYSVTRLYPTKGQEEMLEPGRSIFVGTPASGESAPEVYLPDAPFWTSSRDTFKVVASAKPGDLAFLEQPAMRVPPPPRRTRTFRLPIVQTVEAALSGFGAASAGSGGTRHIRPSHPRSGEDWGTSELSIQVVRAPSRHAITVGETRDLEAGVQIIAPAGFAGSVSLSLDRLAPDELLKLPAGLGDPAVRLSPLALRQTRSASAPLTALHIEADSTALHSISRENPLRVRLPAETRDGVQVIPVVFDGDDYLIGGYEGAAPDEIEIVHVPPGALGAAEGQRGLLRSLRVFFLRIAGVGGAPLGMFSVASDGSTTPAMADTIKPGQRVALLVHGFLADTNRMIELLAPFLREQVLPYDHVLAWNYESFSQGADSSARELADALAALGFNAADDRTLHIYGHSLGGLVVRSVIEHSGGAAYIDKFAMTGVPNLGTKLANYSRGLVFYASVMLNDAAYLPFFNPAGIAVRALYDGGKTWADLREGSPFLAALNGAGTPASVPYLAVRGNNTANLERRGRMHRLANKLLDEALDIAYGVIEHDLVVSATSGGTVRGGTYPALTSVLTPSDHFGYFTSPESRAALQSWVRA